MPALNTSLKVARIAEASSVPYLEKLAKVAVAVLDLLEKKGKNKAAVKELCESINNTIAVVHAVVGMQVGNEETYFQNICVEMVEYLDKLMKELKDTKQNYHGLRNIFDVDKFRDAIQAYENRVKDLKIDFMIQVIGNCRHVMDEYKQSMQDCRKDMADCKLLLIEIRNIQHNMMDKM